MTTFSLHAHESTASKDSGTPIETMARMYDEAGVDLVGFVGHDERPNAPDNLPVETMTGTERELRKKPTRLHLLDFPDQDLRILAHPSLTYPNQTEQKAETVARRVGADAIEEYNRGTREIDPDGVSFPTVGADDAHNSHQIATSVTKTRAPADPDAVAQAIKRGQVTPVNNGKGGLRYYAGRLHQGLNMI